MTPGSTAQASAEAGTAQLHPGQPGSPVSPGGPFAALLPLASPGALAAPGAPVVSGPLGAATPASAQASAGVAAAAGKGLVAKPIAFAGPAKSGAAVASSATALVSEDASDLPTVAASGSDLAKDGGAGADSGGSDNPESSAGQPSAAPLGAPALAGAQPAFALPPATPGVTASPATVQSLAAEMVRRLDQRVSRFEVALNPAGLGHVTVSLQIDARGGLSASLACHQPHAAGELQARAGDLQQALQAAGFDVPSGALSFSTSGGADQGPGQDQTAPAPLRFAQSFTTDDLAPVPLAWARPVRGLDIHV